MNQEEWKAINQERGELIEQGIKHGLSTDQTTRLDALQRIADEHLDRVAPRSTAALDCLEDTLLMTQARHRVERAFAGVLEAIAALETIHSWLVCGAIATPDDMAQSFSRMEQLISGTLAKLSREAVPESGAATIVEEVSAFNEYEAQKPEAEELYQAIELAFRKAATETRSKHRFPWREMGAIAESAIQSVVALEALRYATALRRQKRAIPK